MLSKLTKLSEEYNVYGSRASFFKQSLLMTPNRSPSYWLTKYNVLIYSNVESGLLTNPLSSADPGATMTFVAGGALKPIGGHILSHASATRLYLRKGSKC